MSLNVYLAAPYALRDHLRDLSQELELLGHRCTSSWLIEKQPITAGTVGATTDLTDGACDVHVANDLRDIGRSDVLVVWTWDAAMTEADCIVNSGGRHIETGAALALGKRVLVIGPPENIFHRSTKVDVVEDWHEACLVLAVIDRAQPRAMAG